MSYLKVSRIPVAVDCIIFGFNENRLELLLVHRGFEPEKGKWSLIGGFVKENEDIDKSAYRVLEKLTGLENIYMEQVRVFGKLKRDPVERVLSVTYYALIRTDSYSEDMIKSYNARWFPLDGLPELIFDHKEMVESAIRRLRRKVKVEPIGFNLLPKKFTLPQLQMLYEAIYGQELDKRNFRKKIATLDILEKQDEKERESSRRGAYYFKFNSNKIDSSGNFNL